MKIYNFEETDNMVSVFDQKENLIYKVQTTLERYLEKVAIGNWDEVWIIKHPYSSRLILPWKVTPIVCLHNCVSFKEFPPKKSNTNLDYYYGVQLHYMDIYLTEVEAYIAYVNEVENRLKYLIDN